MKIPKLKKEKTTIYSSLLLRLILLLLTDNPAFGEIGLGASRRRNASTGEDLQQGSWLRITCQPVKVLGITRHYVDSTFKCVKELIQILIFL